MVSLVPWRRLCRSGARADDTAGIVPERSEIESPRVGQQTRFHGHAGASEAGGGSARTEPRGDAKALESAPRDILFAGAMEEPSLDHPGAWVDRQTPPGMPRLTLEERRLPASGSTPSGKSFRGSVLRGGARRPSRLRWWVDDACDAGRQPSDHPTEAEQPERVSCVRVSLGLGDDQDHGSRGRAADAVRRVGPQAWFHRPGPRLDLCWLAHSVAQARRVRAG